MRNFILNIKFIRYSPFWWWVRLMSHYWFRFDDYHIWKEFWCSLNSGWNTMQYVYEFEKVWGKGSYPPERIVLSQRDFDSLQQRLAEPPKFNQGLSDLLNRKSPFDDEK